MAYETLLAVLVVYAPLAGALLAGFWPRGSQMDTMAMRLATGCVLVSALCASLLFLPHALGNGQSIQHTLVLAPWLDVGPLKANWAIRLDSLSILMMFVVTSVSLIVHVYSFSYMEKDPNRALFFSYLSLFTFAMLMLISADDFLQLFFGWEGVGLASYLLIGFWYRKPSAGAAAIKAFVTNRVGDAGFVLGILTLLICFGSIRFQPIFDAIIHNTIINPIALAEAAPARDVVIAAFGMELRALELAGFLLFIGAMGKSAQFILHVWLPDAMEGPTPVSALIHAATMVTAGVFLVCRCSALYEYAPNAAAFITIIGAITTLFAATIAVVQNDIKRIVAYSTCSQLGYMFFAAGLGAYAASMFHLFTHAFFKALLFLSAGAVIHGFHHEQDIRKMGGLQIKMPFIWVMMLIGTLALTGIGIPGTAIGFAGFFSKDAIIESAFMAHTDLGQMAFICGLLAAALTSFYSWRLMLIVFHGSQPSDWGRFSDAHDAPSIMRWTLSALALGAIIAGVSFSQAFLGSDQTRFWGQAIHVAGHTEAHSSDAGHHEESAHAKPDDYDEAHNMGIRHAPSLKPEKTQAESKAHTGGQDAHASHESEPYETAHHHPPDWVLWAPLIVSILGFAVALLLYAGRDPSSSSSVQASSARMGPLRLFLVNKWYFDHLYQAVFVRGAERLGDLFWKIGDQTLIDGGGPDGLARLAKSGSRRLSRLHTGYIFHYAFIMLLALAVLGAGALIGASGVS